MTEWTHNICERDWYIGSHGVLENGVFREPTRAKDTAGVCCVCGAPTVSGIFIRADEKYLRCRGDHDHPERWSPIIGGVSETGEVGNDPTE
jgi:hypothetical protein